MNPETNIIMNRELIKACQENNTSLILEMLDKGYDATTYRNEPLRLAIKNNNLPVVQKLLDLGISPNQDASQGYISAIRLERIEILKMFIAKEPPTMAILSISKQCTNSQIKEIINDSFKKQLSR